MSEMETLDAGKVAEELARIITSAKEVLGVTNGRHTQDKIEKKLEKARLLRCLLTVRKSKQNVPGGKLQDSFFWQTAKKKKRFQNCTQLKINPHPAPVVRFSNYTPRSKIFEMCPSRLGVPHISAVLPHLRHGQHLGEILQELNTQNNPA